LACQIPSLYFSPHLKLQAFSLIPGYYSANNQAVKQLAYVEQYWVPNRTVSPGQPISTTIHSNVDHSDGPRFLVFCPGSYMPDLLFALAGQKTIKAIFSAHSAFNRNLHHVENFYIRMCVYVLC